MNERAPLDGALPLEAFTPYTWPGVETGTLAALARIERDDMIASEQAARAATAPLEAVEHRRVAAVHVARLQQLNVLIQQAGGQPVAAPMIRVL